MVFVIQYKYGYTTNLIFCITLRQEIFNLNGKPEKKINKYKNKRVDYVHNTFYCYLVRLNTAFKHNCPRTAYPT